MGKDENSDLYLNLDEPELAIKRRILMWERLETDLTES